MIDLQIPITADISGQLKSLAYWELIEYVSTFVVFLGVLGEILAEFTDLLKTQRDETRKKRIIKLSSVILLIGLGGELAALIRTSTLTGQITEALRNDITAAYRTATTANTEAAKANDRAGQANERAEGIAKENTILKGKFENATAEANVKQEELKRQNFATQRKLEAERKTRLELETSLAPRKIQVITGGEPPFKSNFDSLKPFKGLRAEFEVVNDVEARRAAGMIAYVLEQAGWQVSGVPPRPELESPQFDGVRVEGPWPVQPNSSGPDPESGRLIAAQSALCHFLTEQNWQANPMPWPWSKNQERQPNTIRVLVGLKPSPFFDPDWVKRMREYSKEQEDEREKPLKEQNEADRKRMAALEVLGTRAKSAEAGSSSDLQLIIKQLDGDPSAQMRFHAYSTLQALALRFEYRINQLKTTNSLGYAGTFTNAEEMIAAINKPDVDPLTLAIAFHDMKKLTGWNVDMFNIRAANRWCDEHKCDQVVPPAP